MKKILERFKEPSTWAALAVILAGTPVGDVMKALSEYGPELATGVAALAAVALKEGKQDA